VTTNCVPLPLLLARLQVCKQPLSQISWPHLTELLSIQFRRWGWPDHISTARQTKVNNNRIYIRFMNTQQHITKDASAGSQLFGTHSGSGTVRNHVLDINTSVTLSITLKNTSNIMSTPCRHWKLMTYCGLFISCEH